MPWRCSKCRSLSKETGPKAPKCQQKGCNFAVCVFEEDRSGKVRNGNFTITDASLDMDMQKFDLTANVTAVQAKQMLDDGKKEALRLLLAKLDADDVKLIDPAVLTLELFKNSGQLYQAKDDSAQHAEWKCEIKGRTKGRNASDLEITATIDIDDIPPGKKPNGPDRPHVGWTLHYRPPKDARGPKGKYNGHVFIDRAYVSRNGTPAVVPAAAEQT